MSIYGMEVSKEISEQGFRRAFVEMKMLVDILLQERHERQLRKAHKDKKKEEAESLAKDEKAKGVGVVVTLLNRHLHLHHLLHLLCLLILQRNLSKLISLKLNWM